MFKYNATRAIYKISHNQYKNLENLKYKIIYLFKFILIGFIGSIILSTISDSIIPYLSETILKIPFKEIHISFLKEFILVNLFAILGFIFAYIKYIHHITHFFHIFISIFASLILISFPKNINFNFYKILLVFIILIIAFIIPYVFSDFFPIKKK